MRQSLFIFTKEIFDYAGLFPPAQLSLSKALSNFSYYQTHEQKSCLGKFIFPVEKSEELVSFLLGNKNYFSSFSDKQVLFSIILSKYDEYGANLSEMLESDIKKLESIRSHFKDSVQFTSFEILPPAGIFLSIDKQEIFQYLVKTYKKLNEHEPGVSIYFEVPYRQGNGEFFLQCLSEYNRENNISFAVKLRAGGTQASQIPSAEDLARVILWCSKCALPVKLTAGLHVPVPNFNDDVGGTMHGFLNVLGALILAYAKFYFMQDFNVGQKDLETVLAHFHYKDFNFMPEGVLIGENFIANELLTKIRAQFVKSIGTCSFLEPIDHLKDNYKKGISDE